MRPRPTDPRSTATSTSTSGAGPTAAPPDSGTGGRPTLASALAAGPVVLDGGLSTELERAGYDISGRLWSAALLATAPDAARRAHEAFFAAGAEVATTATYQASFEGFAAAGVDRSGVARLLRRGVALAREAAGDAPRRWVAASVGPYGAVLAGGQEYTGEYARPGAPGTLDVAALRAWHRPRLELLAGAGPDVLALETLPAAAEAEALLVEVAALGVPAWLSLTTVTDDAGRVRTRLGEDAGEVFALARDVPEVIAVGVNCTDPDGVDAAVALAAAASGKPVVVYPNSGETWDDAARRWAGPPGPASGSVSGSPPGSPPGFRPTAVRGWASAGARLVGGCCRVGPEQITAVRTALAPGIGGDR